MNFAETIPAIEHITLVVHGVGEASRLATAVHSGFLLHGAPWEATAAPISFSAWLSKSHQLDWKLEGFVAQHAGKQRLLIAMNWSDSRSRIERWTSDTTVLSPKLMLGLRLSHLMDTATALLESLGQARRCTAQAKSKAALALVTASILFLYVLSIAYFAFSFAVILGPVFGFGYSIYRRWGIIRSWGVIALCGVVAVHLRGLIARYLLDMAIDVPHFVGEIERRERLEEDFVSILSLLNSGSGGKPMCIVAHSLGSVLVSHALSKAKCLPNVTLVTLGSPLGYIGHVFNSFLLPANLKIQLQRRVQGWIHGYREGDYVGRELMPDDLPFYRELALGWGAHGNYFGSAAFWEIEKALAVGKPVTSTEAPSPDINEKATAVVYLGGLPLLIYLDWRVVGKMSGLFPKTPFSALPASPSVQ